MGILSTLKAMRVDEIKYTRNVSDWYLNDPAGRWTQGMPPCPNIPSISYSLPNTFSGDRMIEGSDMTLYRNALAKARSDNIVRKQTSTNGDPRFTSHRDGIRNRM